MIVELIYQIFESQEPLLPPSSISSAVAATMSVGRMKSAVEAQMHRNGALIALAVYLYHSTGINGGLTGFGIKHGRMEVQQLSRFCNS